MVAPVLLLVDKFKGSLAQSDINRVLSGFFRDKGIAFIDFEIADGGEGTVSALIKLGWRAIELDVKGPIDNQHRALLAFNEKEGIVALELAELCGIRWLNGSLEPATASTRAIGDALLQIEDLEWRELWIGLGGSASNDGGLGILQALGIRALDKRGVEIKGSGLAALRKVHRLGENPRGLIADILRGRNVRIISDVASPLLGDRGAIKVFGPQKGLNFLGRHTAERAMRKWSRIIGTALIDEPGAGSAGGTGFLLLSLFDAEYNSGVEVFLDLLRIKEQIEPGTLIVAGEGRIDQSSLAGKSVLPILRLAKENNARVLLICGDADKRVLNELCSEYPIVGTVALADSGLKRSVLMERAEELLYDQMMKVCKPEWLHP